VCKSNNLYRTHEWTNYRILMVKKSRKILNKCRNILRSLFRSYDTAKMSLLPRFIANRLHAASAKIPARYTQYR
jgi:hypothetical protein